MIDVETYIYNAMWAIWEADAAWAALFPVGNRVKYTNNGVVTPVSAQTGDGDYPQVVLYYPRRGRYALYQDETRTQTFASESQGAAALACGGLLEKGELVYSQKITTELMDAGVSDLLKTQTIASIRRAGPGLGGLTLGGKPFIASTVVAYDTKETASDTANGRFRLQTTLDWRIDFVTDSVNLL